MTRAIHVGRSSPSAPPSSTAASTSACSRARPPGVELLLFDREDDAVPSRVIRIDPATNRTYHYWHVFVPGRAAGTALRLSRPGTVDPRAGTAFDPAKVLLDPYGRGVVVPKNYSREAAQREGDNAATAMKSVVVDPRAYDWEGDAPLQPPVLAHHHLRDARPRLHAPSQFRRRREDARHVCRPDREDPLSPSTSASPRWSCCRCSSSTPRIARRARSTTGAMRRSRSSRRTRRTARARTRSARWTSSATWSRRCTARASRSFSTSCSTTPPRAIRRARRSASAASTTRPTTSSKTSGARYANYTGCGNTLNANHPIVRRMILDSLRYWVEEMHVDGFRFDLASILSRDASRPAAAESAGALGHRVRPGAGRDQAHRRGVGRGRAVPGRQLRRRRLEGVERPVPRRRPRLLPRRAGVGAARGGPDARQPRDLRPQAARGGAERQLRDLPRRLHAQRPRLLQPQAQRGERRGKPRRRQRQPQLELRRRGPDRRPGGREACATGR